MAASLDLLRGTLDLLVLQTLRWRPLHGYDITSTIRQRTAEQILVEEGALYPALHRLERRGLLKSSWGYSENNRKARYYELTAAGRRQLRAEIAQWERYTRAVALMLSPGEEV